LLSYYNQTDHEKIDRTSDIAKQLLIDLARGELLLKAARSSSQENTDWLTIFSQRELPVPDAESVTLAGQVFPFAWRNHRIAASTEILSIEAIALADEKGWTLFKLTPKSPHHFPDALVNMLKS
jgi:hypothetical protein